MSQNFKLKFDEMQENNSADVLGTNVISSNLYDTPGNVRNLCFVWPNGRMKFLNYAYLITGEYNPDLNEIKLIFTTESIVVKGKNLMILFKHLLIQKCQCIICLDTRYEQIQDYKDFVVTEIVAFN